MGCGTGVCGSIAKTPLRRLFPFRAQSSKWALQFDTRKVYKRATGSATKRKVWWFESPRPKTRAAASAYREFLLSA